MAMYTLVITIWLLLLGIEATHSNQPCSEEGHCQTVADTESFLICASGIWQEMPRGTWTCKNGVLIPDQITTSSFSTSPTVECYSTISEIGSTCNSVTTTSSAQSPAVSASLPKVVYEGSYSAYYGDGSAAQGWPNIDGWIDFEKM